MSESVRAEKEKIDTTTNAVRQRVQRTIGAMQTSAPQTVDRVLGNKLEEEL